MTDEEARRRATEETRVSLLVEASAGTGKTHTLVERILRLVVKDGVPLPRIAAVTFTEKAAGEMKLRVRKRLEEIPASPSGEEARRAERARRDLESAEIGTLHAFCARLLRERPVEAGLDPEFLFPDESVANDLVRQAFRLWALEEADRDGSALGAALRAGAKGRDLRLLAEELYAARTLLDDAHLPTDVLGEARAAIENVRSLFEELWASAGAAERADARGRQVRAFLEELAALPPLDVEALAAWRPVTDLRQARGGAGCWRELSVECKAAFAAARDLRDRLGALPLASTLVDLVGSYRESLFAAIEEEKRRRGFLDFDDLLLETRRLLRASPAARAHFRERWSAILVDEFQDTDPVQAEIVLRLSAPEPQGDALASLVPDPGRLFLVGDPKQSIFRFRRADVETYDTARALFPESARLVLTASRRAKAPLLAYVNEVFEPVLRAEAGKPWEVGYAPLEPAPGARETPRPEIVHLAAPEDAPASRDDLRRDEARAVANFLHACKRRGSERWSSFAVLTARNESVELYRDVLTEYEIPAVLEGGTSFYRREETAAVLAALSAIDDAGDGVALVAALKSFLFGVDDLELLEAAEAGVRFDAPGTLDLHAALRDAAGLFARLRRARHERPLAETVLDLLDARAAPLAALAGALPWGRQAAANLDRLVLHACALDREGLSFREARERLAGRVEDREAEPRAVEDEFEAVRLTTIHKAKGLEYDTVVAAGLGLTTERDPQDLLRAAGGEWGARVAFGEAVAATPGFSRVDAADRVRRDAERKRLLYVAFTRARRRLVVSTFARPKASGGLYDNTFLAPIAFALVDGALKSRVERLVGDTTPPPSEARNESLALFAPDLPAELALVEERHARLGASASRPLRRAGASSDDPPRPEDLPALERDGAGAHALRIGVAVHAAMERLLAPDAPLPDAERADAVVDALPDLPKEDAPETRRLVRRLLRDDVVARALASRRRFLELPLLFRDGDAPDAPLVEGKIDLLFEEEDGYTIVDWKTDRVAGEAERLLAQERYAPQLAAYAAGIAAVLGPSARIKEARLVFARA
ncbi:MAG TPA: UvrD-helicase domain-containing protein [Thermoanaerobaculia bacterium]|nr:UvrD-helicase domain-containing protein [Thermoanaerobaculia bacterium]